MKDFLDDKNKFNIITSGTQLFQKDQVDVLIVSNCWPCWIVVAKSFGWKLKGIWTAKRSGWNEDMFEIGQRLCVEKLTDLWNMITDNTVICLQGNYSFIMNTIHAWEENMVTKGGPNPRGWMVAMDWRRRVQEVLAAAKSWLPRDPKS